MKVLISVFLLLLLLLGPPAPRLQAAPPGFWRAPGGNWGMCRYMISSSRGDLFATTFPTGLVRSTTHGAVWEQTTLTTRYSVTALGADSSGRLFAGISGVIFRSSDRGGTWTECPAGLPGGYIVTICCTPSGVLLVCPSTRGFYGSTDGGESWVPWSPGWESSEPVSMGLGLDGVLLSWVNGRGMLRSTDNGVSWTRLSIQLSTGSVTGFVADSAGLVFAATENGVLRSTDNGLHWDTSGLAPLAIRTLMRARGGILFAALASGGLYRSTDRGVSWQRRDAGLTDSYVYSMAQALDGSVMAGTMSRFYRSTNLGDTWYAVTWGAEGASVTSLAALPSGRMICATKNMGLLSAADTGFIWSPLKSSPGIEQTVALLTPADSGRLFAVTDSGALYQSLEEGKSWTRLPAPWKNIRVGFLQSLGSGLLVAGVVSDGLYRSTNSGLEWDDISAGLTNRFLRCMVTVPGRGYLVGTDEGVFHAKSLGSPWEPSGLPGKTVWSLGRYPGGEIFAGTAGDGMFCSTDGGESWASLSGSLPAMNIWTILSDGRSAVYAGTLGLGVYQWLSNTRDWRDISDGLKMGDVGALVINRKGLLFAGTRNGVYQSMAPVLTSIGEEGSTRGVEAPFVCTLAQNYPNPFNPSTTIVYLVPAGSPVRLAVYDLLGREVRLLVDEVQPAGRYEVYFNGGGLSSGAYVYRLTVGGSHAVKRMVLIR